MPYFICKHSQWKENPDVNLLYLPGVPQASLTLISWPGTHWPKVIRQDRDLLLSNCWLSSSSFVWSEVEEIISTRAAECDWVLSDHSGFRRTYTLHCAPLCSRSKAWILQRDQKPQFWSDHGHGACWRPLLQTHGWCRIKLSHVLDGLPLLHTCVCSSSGFIRSIWHWAAETGHRGV